MDDVLDLKDVITDEAKIVRRLNEFCLIPRFKARWDGVVALFYGRIVASGAKSSGPLVVKDDVPVTS